MPKIVDVKSLEILDSRGKPTLKTYIKLEGQNTFYSASVPSGASTGVNEAVELRDGDATRFGGFGCQKAVRSINVELKEELVGKTFVGQHDFDQFILKLDGTPNKENLGGNCLLSLSLAFARANTSLKELTLFDYFSQLAGVSPKMPKLTVNLFSGGKHAGGQVPIQDILIVPQAVTVQQALEMTYKVYYAAANLLKEKFNTRLLRADEGGLSPNCDTPEEMFELARESIEAAGYQLGREIFLAVDVAASHFYENGSYNYCGQSLEGSALIQKLIQWKNDYSILSIEDGLEEEDWENWPQLVEELRNSCDVMGDDLLCTNPKLIQKAQEKRAATALLLKVNQVGTLTEAVEAFKLAKSKNWNVTVSARSGETEDDWLADLAYGLGGDFIKIGSITQSERLSKYNRLLELEYGYN